jgi:PAS domain S-box-containing protein
MNAQTVLIIDDDKDLCSNLEDILKDNGYEPSSAYTCAEGLMLTHTLKPHVVLLDHRLPDCSGTELLSKLKQMNPDCFCVIITAYADIDSAVHAMEKGAFHYLRKPFNPSELLQLLERIFGIIRLREEKNRAKEYLRDNEEKYRTLVENLNIGIYRNTGGPQGHFIQVNPAMVKMFGYDSAEEFMKISASDLYQDPDERKKYIEKIHKKGVVKEEELKMKKKDGTPIWASLTASAQYDEKGDIKWIDGVVDDITERKRMDELEKESRAKYEAIVETFDGLIYICSADYKIEFVNKRFIERTGYYPVGQECYKALHDLEDICSWCVNEQVFKGETVRWEVQSPKDNQWYYVVNTPISHSDGSLSKIAMIQDITNRKLAEEKLKESEKKYKELADLLPQIVFEIDTKGNVTFLNRNAFEVFGYTEDDFLKGLNALDLFVPEDRESVLKNIQRRLSGEKLGSVEHTAVRKDGTKIPVIIDSNPIVSGNIPAGLRGILIDITERKKMEKNLRTSEERYRALYEDNPSMYFTVDSQGIVLSVNPFGAEQLGYTVHELIGQSVLNVFYPDDKEAVKQQVAVCLQNPGKVNHWELRKVRKDGSMLWVRESARAVQGVDGKPIVLVVCEDITKRKQAEEEHAKLEQQLLQAQKMEAIGQLAGGIAHDFNNLLTAIIGYGHLLRNESSQDDRMNAYIAQILSAAERAAILTNDLLTFGRKQIVNLQPVNLNKIIKNMKRLLLRVIGEDIELSTVLTDTDLTIMADSTQIDQILMNLATNAQDAMPKGGSLNIRTDRVEINGEYIKDYGYGKPGSYAILSVEDTGTGMDKETRERIFEPFFTTKEVGKGTGLGLSMLYGIVKQHDGYINVYSEPGRGTTFKILLPLVQSRVEELRPKGLTKVKGGTETILIGEDDTRVRNLLKEVLSNAGYHIVEAVDGDNAEEVFHKNKDNIHLLILDLIMPKKNGKEVYAEIKKVKSDMKVIFVSGYSADIIHKKGMLEVGLNFISKPVSPDELLIKVRNVLDK